MLHGRGVRPSALDVVVVAPRKRRDARYELLVVATVDQTLIRGLGPHGNSSSEGCLALLTGIFAQQSSAEGSFWSVPMP
jgi:hypothetical protein